MLEGVLLEVKGLKKYYPIAAGLLREHVGDVKAVDGVSLKIREGETLGLVGESGCGKSTLGRTILRLEEPTAGQILFRGRDITRLPRTELRKVRREFQMIFQDPQSSLDPRMMVADSIGEALLLRGIASEKERWQRAEELLPRVGLERQHMWRYPHELSGGQKQRVGIARALAANPRLIVADEPVSALDVSIQAQILNLLARLRNEFGLSYLFIAHDLSVIRYVSDTVAIMYVGKIVEIASKQDLFSHPLHPYTQALLAAVLPPDPRQRQKGATVSGEPPSPLSPPPGCRFHPRCPYVMPVCSMEEPPLTEMSSGRWVACHLY